MDCTEHCLLFSAPYLILSLLVPLESCQLDLEKKGQRKVRDLGDCRARGDSVDDKIRDIGEAQVQALALCVCVCVCVCAIMCVYRVCTCVGVCTMPATVLCRWLLCMCMRVYIVQGWDMETQHPSVCFSGLS
jgi:hypothetical protein